MEPELDVMEELVPPVAMAVPDWVIMAVDPTVEEAEAVPELVALIELEVVIEVVWDCMLVLDAEPPEVFVGIWVVVVVAMAPEGVIGDWVVVLVAMAPEGVVGD